MEQITCEQCAKTLNLASKVETEDVLGWVKVPAVMYGHLEWWILCADCGAPERLRESMDAYTAGD